MNKVGHAANLECDEDAQNIGSASTLAHIARRFPIIARGQGYNWSMTLSSALVGALRSFNKMDPMTRSGLLPIVDGADFLHGVMSSRSNQPRAVAGSNLPAPEEASMSSQSKRGLVEGAGDSIRNAKLDPYVFSPPGMDIS